MDLKNLQDLFQLIYEGRTRIAWPSLIERIAFLNFSIAELQDAIRKDGDVGIALARVMARIFAVANYFDGLSLTRFMALKYVENGCVYCWRKPCACSERRKAPDLERVFVCNEQMEWDLKTWCLHLKTVYGEKNEERGIEYVLNRLFKEISELLLLSFSHGRRSVDLSAEDVVREFALEIVDALAWTIAVANLLDVDLQTVVLDRYEDGCWKCKNVPCKCPIGPKIEL